MDDERRRGPAVVLATPVLVPPWPLDIHGLVFGEELGEHTRRRLLLEPDAPDELDDLCGGEWWSNPDDSICVTTCGLRVGLVNLSDSAILDGVEMIGASRHEIIRRLGLPTGLDHVADSISFDEGEWSLDIGFDEERVSWVFISSGHVLDDT